MAERGPDWLRRTWDEAAPRYDRDIAWFERALLADGREWVCGQATGEVLEVAVGTGRNLPLYPPDVRLTGIDLSPSMLDLARRRAAETGREATLTEADAQSLPFPDSTFDTVVCTLGLCGVTDERGAIAEMHRVLRPGGRLLLLDHVGSHRRFVLAGQRLLEKLTVSRLGDYLTRRPLPLLAAAGFAVERAERSKAGIVERVAARKTG
ncbi:MULTISPECIES: class I SAM-dependent methyltransferase [unclassified Amycolatopsis]|uniref:class I SAM-dependent methyltransferase n=1 Tax=unclassified Amycolatopsis TaxID=2618356 RepID=UPI00106EAF25|nr:MULTISPECIES: class I SAM-dependent methyltransferase [unclassified Amycolatopsis]